MMAQDRTSRCGAMLIALGVQALFVLVLGGIGIASVRQEDVPALSVLLVPEEVTIAEPPASRPQVHVHLRDPGIPPPAIPMDLDLAPSAPATPQIPATVPRTTNDESAGATIGTESRIGIVSRVDPEYPQGAVERRAQGTTSVAILVDANGHPGAVRVLQSSGDPQLDAAAVRAVQKWEFTAATSHSHVVPSWGRLEVNFDLTLFHQEHPDSYRGAGGEGQDPAARLGAVIKSWSADPAQRSRNRRDQHNLDLQSPALKRLLEKFGPVHSVHFLGVASRAPQATDDSDAQSLRVLDASSLAGWDEFEVVQLRGRSRWYCAVDEAGQIQGILVNAAEQ
jgi:TonB family protein